MDTNNLLSDRRSPSASSLRDPVPNEAQLSELLQLSMRVPDHGRLAPWRFVVMTGEGRARYTKLCIEAFAKKNPEATVEERMAAEKKAARAPMIVAVIVSPVEHPKIPQWEMRASAAAVCQTMLLACHAMGFAGVWLTGWAATDAHIKTGLGLAAHEDIIGLIHIGTPDAWPQERERPTLADKVSWL